jgi:hypothetical protein
VTDTIFFRLLDGVNRPSRLSGAIEELREGGGETSDVHQANPDSFRQVPGSPFAYWVSEEMRTKFAEMPPFEGSGRTVRVGLQTSDDFRFVRASWEVAPQDVARGRKETLAGKRWVPFAKGGEYSPHYSDVHLVVNWEGEGEEIKEYVCASYPYLKGKWEWVVKHVDFYFHPGLTWPRRTQSGLSVRAYPAECIFADKGPVVFAKHQQLAYLLAITNSRAFHTLVELQMAFGSYEAGVIQRTPVPDIPEIPAERLGNLALHCVDVKRELDTVDETSHAFRLSALLQTEGAPLEKRLACWQDRILGDERQLTAYQREIDEITFGLYGIEGEDRRAIEELLDGESGTAISSGSDESAETEDTGEAAAILDGGTLVADLLSYSVGCVFGRWDARIALNPSLAPKLADPFAPLPVCSPGMLVGPDGLPAQRNGIASEEWMQARPDAITPPPEGSVQSLTISDSEYPLTVDWDGILVDDPDHPDDVVRRVRGVLELLWGKRADAIEGEACGLLGVKDLRTYFRNPRQFFEHHIKRHSKSRRKAPIYWLLQSPKRNYGLWLYYHRLDPDILFKALTNYVEPKIRLEEGRLEDFEARRRNAGMAGREAKQAEKEVAKQEELLADLREFRDRLDRAARLHLRPDLNDGVALNTAPLHELMPQPWKEAKGKWNELLAGKYEWSSLGKQLREKGMV